MYSLRNFCLINAVSIPYDLVARLKIFNRYNSNARLPISFCLDGIFTEFMKGRCLWIKPSEVIDDDYDKCCTFESLPKESPIVFLYPYFPALQKDSTTKRLLQMTESTIRIRKRHLVERLT